MPVGHCCSINKIVNEIIRVLFDNVTKPEEWLCQPRSSKVAESKRMRENRHFRKA